MVISLRESVGPAGGSVLGGRSAGLVDTETKLVSLNKISLIPLPGGVEHESIGIVTARCDRVDGIGSNSGWQVKIQEGLNGVTGEGDIVLDFSLDGYPAIRGGDCVDRSVSTIEGSGVDVSDGSIKDGKASFSCHFYLVVVQEILSIMKINYILTLKTQTTHQT